MDQTARAVEGTVQARYRIRQHLQLHFKAVVYMVEALRRAHPASKSRKWGLTWATWLLTCQQSPPNDTVVLQPYLGFNFFTVRSVVSGLLAMTNSCECYLLRGYIMILTLAFLF